MSSDAASRRSLLGLAGVASLCCLAPGTAAVSGGVAASGLGAGLGQVAVTVLTLGVIGSVLRWRRNCSRCEA
ncbi:hypothetical protein [Natronorubrum daqingense]|uniref:Uncharacterized protein n=1 Tax=Natronorubrum daqingense TaxID=588898 RepID=A0A1N7FKA4_9EURY|nr:hypothetical protein [Natronorubrum daqingense]APX98340.1 hypothetical protein BB347_16650 [Natronorubrum daqingense]SIS00707.1 hypothetical protein SAMN05421809_3305 [Natronorubrum daqingense]